MTRAAAWFVGCWLGVAGMAAATDPIENNGWGKPVNGLQCRATLRGNDNESDLELIAKSVADQPIYLFAPGNALWRFLELTNNRVPVRRTDEREDWNINEAPQHFVRIEPGRLWVTHVDLSRGWRPETRLAWDTTLTEVTYRNPNKSGKTIGINGWTGEFSCPVVRSSN